MKTEKDLRLMYKREMSLEAFNDIEIETEIPDIEDKTIAELKEDISIEIPGYYLETEIPYINWLEEKLIEKWQK